MAILTLLMISSVIFVLSSSSETTVKASIPSDMLQYEWISPATSPERTFLQSGPGPDSPSITWKTRIPGVAGSPVAFNGMVFATGQGTTYALDGATGEIVWTAPGVSGEKIKIDSTYMVIGKYGVKIADGTTVWTGPSGFSYGQGTFGGTGYIPELKLFVDQITGWSLPDPSQPPTLAWNITDQVNVGRGDTVYGDGKLFIGRNDGTLTAVDAETATLLWKVSASSTFCYGMSYADGKVFHGGLDNNMRAWDGDTGELLWTYNPGSWYGLWASASGAAYGMVYEHN